MRTISFIRPIFALACAALFASACGGSDENDGTSAGDKDACFKHSDCPGGDPFCVGGRCVECQSPADCTNQGETCDSVSGKCKPTCTDSTTCAQGDANLCNTTRGVCVRCIQDTDCGGGDPYCNPTRDRCVECRSKTDCGAGEPICLPGRGKCVECVGNGDCDSSSPFCDVEDNDCVQCLSKADCPNGVCNKGKCESPCVDNTSCKGDLSVCDTPSGQCVECLVKADCTEADKPHCETKTRKCVECVAPTDCPADKTCNADNKCK